LALLKSHCQRKCWKKYNRFINSIHYRS